MFFFLIPPFQNLGLKVVPLAKSGAGMVLILLIYAGIMTPPPSPRPRPLAVNESAMRSSKRLFE